MCAVFGYYFDLGVLGIKFRALYMLSTHLTLIYTLRSMDFKLLFEPLGGRGYWKPHISTSNKEAFVYFCIPSSVKIQILSVKGLSRLGNLAFTPIPVP